jgi:hypothetical protein
VTEPLIVRPRRVRVVAWLAAAAVVVFFTVIATALARGEAFGPGDQGAMIGLGLVFAAGILAFTRPMLRADASGVRIRNVIGGYELPWQVIRSVRFEHGAAWVTLELADDEVVSVLAIQRADRQHAVDSCRALRELLARHGRNASARAEAGTDTDS